MTGGEVMSENTRGDFDVPSASLRGASEGGSTSQGCKQASWHTPAPWRLAMSKDILGQPRIATYCTHNSPDRFWETSITSDFGFVATAKGATPEEAEANAALIVRAVNGMEGLALGIEAGAAGRDAKQLDATRESATGEAGNAPS
jgi:hypothetical protein